MKRRFVYLRFMHLIPELFHPSCFTLLTAPVASGKTRMVVEFYHNHDFKVVYLSPLRALANEVYANLIKRDAKNVFLAGGDKKLAEIQQDFISRRKSFMVTTIELLNEEFVEELFYKEQKVLFVIDEFHLFYHWGESFRPLLHDRFLCLLNFEFPVLAVTATIDHTIMDRLKKDLKYYQDFWIHLDFGNHQLHRPPARTICYNGLHPRYIYRAFWREIRQKKSDEIFLYFCAYRGQVDELVNRARRQGFKAVGCVGGEVENFLQELRNFEGKVDCIFSTTTLSHGVNLPEIKKVFIDYEVKNYDFWLQMIGRGGRQGSPYEVYSTDKFHTARKERLKHKVSIVLSDFLGVEF